MGLRDIESTLPPGFRFYPSDEELVCHYLYKKVTNVKVYEGTMLEVDLHTREPWELPEGAKLSENVWYFFSFRDRKYATGSRTNRATKSGYWKATGKDRTVYHPKTRIIVGMRKTLVFYSGRAPNGRKTSWVMHEFRLENPHTPPKEDWVLCRVFHKKKGENSNNNNTETSFSLDLAEGEQDNNNNIPAAMVDQSMPDGCSSEVVMGPTPHQEGASSASSLLNLGVLQHYTNNSWLGFPQLEEEVGSTSMLGMSMGMDIMGMRMGMGMGMAMMDMMGSKKNNIDHHLDHDDDDDGYGFLLDMGINDDAGKGMVMGNVDDLGF